MTNKKRTFEEELIDFEKEYSQPEIEKANIIHHEQYNLQISIDDTDCNKISESKFKGGLQHSVIRRLKSGKIDVFKEIDMHGLKLDEASKLLNDTLNWTVETKAVCILFIHGKGLGSINKTPVIKPLVKKFLSEHPRVLAYTPAPKKSGGDGATLALIRKMKGS